MDEQSAASSQADDEIDLKELFLHLWEGKFLIALCAVVSISLGSFYLHNATRLYTMQALVMPVESDSKVPNLGGLSNLAGLAGISIPTGSSGDFKAFEKLLYSEELAQRLLDKTTLAKVIFHNEWDEEKSGWQEPQKGALGLLLGQAKRSLTGSEVMAYRAPDAARLADYFDEELKVSSDRDSGYLTISIDHEDPKVGMDLIKWLIAETDGILRETYLADSTEIMESYSQKLARAQSAELREVLAQVIGEEERKQILALEGSHYTARILRGPTASLNPTSPKSSLVLALALVLGCFLGAAMVLIRAAFRPKA